MASEGTKGDLSSPFFMDPIVEKGRADFFKKGGLLERESATSLWISRLLDRRSHRAKKQSCSTQQGLCVGTGF